LGGVSGWELEHRHLLDPWSILIAITTTKGIGRQIACQPILMMIIILQLPEISEITLILMVPWRKQDLTGIR